MRKKDGKTHPGTAGLSTELLENIFNEAGEGIFVCNRDGKFIEVNPQGCELLGYSREEILRLSPSDVILPEDRLANPLKWDEIITGEKVFKEHRLRRKDGSTLIAEINGMLLLDGCVLGLVREIGERRQAEHLLRESEARFSTIFKLSPIPITITDMLNEQWVEVNAAFLALTGFSQDEIIGHTYRELNLWVSLEKHEEMRRTLLERGRVRNFETAIRKKNGAIAEMLISAELLQVDGKQYLMIMASDVTERNRAEEALLRSERRYRVLYEDSPVASWEADFSRAKQYLDDILQQEIADPREYFISHPQVVEQCIGLVQILDASNAALRMYKAQTKQELLESAQRLFAGMELQHLYEDLLAVVQGRLSNCWEGKDRTLDGQPLMISLSWSVLPGHEADYSRVIVTTIDITARRQAEEKTLETEKRYRALIENAPDGIVLVGLDGRYKYVSPTPLKSFGYSMEEFLASDPAQQTHPEDLARVLGVLQDVIEHPAKVPTIRYRFMHKNGFWRWVESTFTNLLAEPSVEAIVINSHDITERIKDEALIFETDERLRLAYDAAEFGTWQEDPIQHQFYLDERARKHFGQSREIVPSQDLYLCVHPDDKPQLMAAIRAVLAPGADGRIRAEYRVIHADRSTHWLAIHGRVHFEEKDGQQQSVLVAGVSQDITARKQAEERLFQRTEQLRLIHESTHKLNVSLDARQVYEVIYESVPRLIPLNTLFVSSYDPTRQMISLVGGIHDGVALDVSNFESIPLEPEGSGTQSEVIRSKEALLIHDFQARLKSTQSVRLFTEDGNPAEQTDETRDIPRSALVVPLLVEGEVIGVIQVFSYQTSAYTEEDLHLLSGFSAQAAIALSNAHLYQHVQQENQERRRAEASLLARTKELEVLFKIADRLGSAQTEEGALDVAMTEMLPLMDAYGGGIVLLEPDQQHFKLVKVMNLVRQNSEKRFSIGEGLCGLVLRDRQAYLVEDYSKHEAHIDGLIDLENLGPGVFAPIRAEHQFSGVLFAARKKSNPPQPYTADSARLLTAVGELVGSTLQRIRLFEQTASHLRHLQSMHKIDLAITGSLDLTLTLRLLLTEITSQPEVDAAAVLLMNPHSMILECAAASGFRSRSIERGRIMVGQGLAGQAALKREMMQVKELHFTEDALRKQIAIEEGFKSYIATPLIVKGKVVGVLEFYSRMAPSYESNWNEFVESIANQATIAIENARLFTDLQRSNLEMELAYEATVESWAHTADRRSGEAAGHTARLVETALALGQSLGLPNEELIHLRRGAFLHDVGTLVLPDEILKKTTSLTEEEWKLIRMHPNIAYEVLQPIEYLHAAISVPYCHHERWDGSGYPRGLMGDQIPLLARIFAVADTFESLLSDRPYRRAFSREQAIAHISEQSGRHFDPQVVDTFLIWARTY